MNTQQQGPEEHILVCVEKPTTEGTNRDTMRWLGFSNDIRDIKSLSEGSDKIAENVWLFHGNLPILRATRLLDQCSSRQLNARAYKILGTVEAVEE